ncbi:SRPBCC domain-containing protein [Pedobacter sp. PAMC26386]|nr:SRPBCC domain-containing protein [Pedobacter sp. PAMC26386]
MKKVIIIVICLFVSITVILGVMAKAKEIKTEILINAAPQKVWAIFSNFDNYPNWNPFIKSIQGRIDSGSKITVRIEPPNGSGMTFNPEVLVFAENKELSWKGKLLFKGLFDGTHKFELIDNGNGTTTFIQMETFTGILVSLFESQLDKTEIGFKSMNVKLKELVEQQ